MQAGAQGNPNSVVFRAYRPPRSGSLSPREQLDRQWTDFMLMRDANAGNREAQHELGLRHLFGDRFERDTVRAAEWIGKAAAQGLTAAQYNYALLLVNGWGAPWNPFEAWRQLRDAAEREFPEAMYLVGSMYTDGLVVARNWREAARWTKKAAEKGFAPAQAALADLFARGYVTAADTSAAVLRVVPGDGSSASALAPARREWTPVYLDFSTDTARRAPPSLEELWRGVRASVAWRDGDSARVDDSVRIDAAVREWMDGGSAGGVDSSMLAPLLRASEAGNGDARVFLARCRAEGFVLGRDLLAAIEGYVGAMFLDAFTAGPLLAEIVARTDVMRTLERRAAAGDLRAMHAVAGLAALGVARSADESRARTLLATAAARGHVPSLLLAGMNAATGRWGTRDLARAEALWHAAIEAGNREAAVRLAAQRLIAGGKAAEMDTSIAVLRAAADEGAVIALVALARGHEVGRGLVRNTGEAVRLYREAALRGSRTGYEALRRMHDALRPDDTVFAVE